MKTIFTAVFFLFFISNIAAQVTNNIRAGYWSDPASWSKNIVPNGTDSVMLDFDIVVDENAACKAFITNGKKVTVNTGITMAVGKPVPPADTATILTIKNYTSSNGIFSDTFIRVIKNDFINGLKRIVITETSTSEPPNYTVFNYNSQQQLVNIRNFWDDPADGDYHVSILYNNNRIVKIITSYEGYADVVDTLTYKTNGTNTDIENVINNTFYNYDSTIAFTKEEKKILTISPSIVPVSWSYYSYLLELANNAVTTDTMVHFYNYDIQSNLMGYSRYTTRKTTDGFGSQGISKDTTIYNYQRNGPDSSTLFKLLLNIYGKELLTYINYDLTWLTIQDVTGFDGGPPFHGLDDQIKSLFKVFYSYRNGKIDEQVDNFQIFRSINSFDNQQRLIKSAIDNGGTVDYIIFKELIYPD
ncbi:MAG: hypothetical protein ABJB11_15060 [Ferruginibacter sp.]